MSDQSQIATQATQATVQGALDAVDDELEVLKLVGAAKGSADVHVELDRLVAFYNTLSEMRAALREHMQTVTTHASDAHAGKPGGAVAGVQDAWTAIAEIAGVAPGGPSLHGNMQAIDNLIASHMAAIAQGVQHYAEQENIAVSALNNSVAP